MRVALIAWLSVIGLVLVTANNSTSNKKISKQYHPSSRIAHLNSLIQTKSSSNYDKLRSRLGTVEKKIKLVKKNKKSNSTDLLMIPVPESQQKPYQPVVVQAQKSNDSGSDAKLVTYKLNKMFVPLGIYGKVLKERKDKQLTNEKIDASSISITTEKVNPNLISLTNDDKVMEGVMRPPVAFPSNNNNKKESVFDKLGKFSLAGVMHGVMNSRKKPETNEKQGSKNKDTETSASEIVGHHAGYIPRKKIIASIPGGVVDYNSYQNQQSTFQNYQQNRPESQSWKDYLFPSSIASFFNLNSRSNIIDRKWGELKRKYTEKELDNARERVFQVFEGKVSRSSHKPAAYEDLMSMFQLVFNFGKGRSDEKVKDFSFVGHAEGDNWKPVSKKDGRPLISFSAGVSYPTQDGNEHYHHEIPVNDWSATTDTFSKAVEPFPETYAESAPKPSYMATQLSNNEQFPPTQTQIKKYRQGGQRQKAVQAQRHYDQSISQSVVKPVIAPKPVPVVQSQTESITSDDSPYELIPSDVYFKNKESADYGEIAAVVKPAHVSDAAVEQVVGGSHRIFSYESPSTLASIQNYLAKDLSSVMGSQSSSQNKKVDPLYQNKLRANAYSTKEQEFVLPQSYYQRPNALPSRRMDETTIVTTQTAQESRPQQSQSQPDLSSFQREMYTNILKKPVKKPAIKFFAPIPINQNVISETLRGRYRSPVPRYVVELAKKLQKDRDVQGIVRVSSRSVNGGPPVEFLYPVRG